MAKTIVRAQNISIRRAEKVLIGDLSFHIAQGQCWAVVGPSGSGKTSLLQALAGVQGISGNMEKEAGLSVAYVAQQHRFLNLSHTATFYYQQRFNAADADDSQTVSAAFPELFTADETARHIQASFGLQALMHRSLLHLSNGENKRLQLAKAFLKKPDLLLLDAPFVGLDAATRELLEERLQALCAGGTAVVLTSSAQRIPSFATHVLALGANGEAAVHDSLSFQQTQKFSIAAFDETLLSALLPERNSHVFETAVRLKNVNISYGDKQILKDINWEVKSGERWALSGRNGAGKSTLLSLITADNPQAYANEIFLFDRRRGSGESIWDIKKKIGFLSPELHLYFDAGASVFDAVASGFFDTIGLFRTASDAQAKKVALWLQLLHLSQYKNKPFARLPLGQQRLVLLARALIKCPPLLVLDEPLQGLDEEQSALFMRLLENICDRTGQTLIYVSHYTEDLPACITQHLVLEGGEVAANQA